MWFESGNFLDSLGVSLTRNSSYEVINTLPNDLYEDPIDREVTLKTKRLIVATGRRVSPDVRELEPVSHPNKVDEGIEGSVNVVGRLADEKGMRLKNSGNFFREILVSVGRNMSMNTPTGGPRIPSYRPENVSNLAYTAIQGL